jgi:hypothetical protein
LSKREELPQGGRQRSLSRGREEKVNGQGRPIGRQDPERTAEIKLREELGSSDLGPGGALEELANDEVAAQNKKEVDAVPPVTFELRERKLGGVPRIVAAQD